MRLLQEYAYDFATGQLGETVLVDGRVQFVVSGEMAVARAPHWTPSDPPIDVEAGPSVTPMPGGDLKVNRHQWTRGGGPDLSERLENLRAPGPTVFGGSARFGMDVSAFRGPSILSDEMIAVDQDTGKPAVGHVLDRGPCHVSAGVVCSMGDHPLQYGGTSDGRGYSVLSREQWERMLKLCRDGEE
jgi:hypothetical protein